MRVVRPRGNHPDGSRTRMPGETSRRWMIVQLKASGRELDDGGVWDAISKCIENHSKENIISGKTLKSHTEKAKAVIV